MAPAEQRIGPCILSHKTDPIHLDYLACHLVFLLMSTVRLSTPRDFRVLSRSGEKPALHSKTTTFKTQTC